MQNVFFMKEPIANAENNVSLITLTQKQLKPALSLTISTCLAQEQKSIILVSLTQEGKEIMNSIPEKKLGRIKVIDAFSKDGKPDANIAIINNPADLTNIQIAIEKAEHSLPGKKILIIDALNVFSIYMKNEALGKFIHIFTNKIRLEEKTAMLFTVKESTDPELLDTLTEFADKTYDYSATFISEINLGE